MEQLGHVSGEDTCGKVSVFSPKIYSCMSVVSVGRCVLMQHDSSH